MAQEGLSCSNQNHKSNENDNSNDSVLLKVPVIDLSLYNCNDKNDQIALAKAVACASSTFGFFEIKDSRILDAATNMDDTGISNTLKMVDPKLIDEFKKECKSFFNLSYEKKVQLKRNQKNARGYFDDELTKQRRDWKEAIDIGIPIPSRDWEKEKEEIEEERKSAINTDSNASSSSSCKCLDGYNQFPSIKDCPNFRDVYIKYFQQCEILSNQIAVLMAKGYYIHLLEQKQLDAGNNNNSNNEDDIHSIINNIIENEDLTIENLRKYHTSYLRVNYYPPYNEHKTDNNNNINESNMNSTVQLDNNTTPIEPLGISPHKDAGFLTILLQDYDCKESLQVYYKEKDKWITIQPSSKHAFTINTGDMAQVWSNGYYQAPLHRVLTCRTKDRISAPFFYNPGYDEYIKPFVIRNNKKTNDNNNTGTLIDNNNYYYPILWGYFRAVRFAGDLTDLGVEIQIEHFLQNKQEHAEKHKEDDADEKKNGNDNGLHYLNYKNDPRHLKRQEYFFNQGLQKQVFDVEIYRQLIKQFP